MILRCASIFNAQLMGDFKMKLKFVFTMMAASGLFVAPAFAGHHGEESKAATEASAESSVTAFVVAATGGG